MRGLNITDPVRRVLVLVAVWFVIVNVFAILSLNRMNLTPDTAFDWMSPKIFAPEQTWNLFSIRDHWDGYWFLDVARNGYYLRQKGALANVVFFPLYPIMIRTFAPIAGGNMILAGWIISTVFLALAVVMLLRIVQEFHPDLDPEKPVLYLLIFPTAFFLNAVYSESLFLFLSLSMFYWALRRNFLVACIFAALASATRLAGVFLFAPLLVEFVQAYGWRALLTRRVFILALAPSGALVFFIYHWIAFDDFFLYLRVQECFGRDFDAGPKEFEIVNNPDLVNTVLDLGYSGAAVYLGFVALRLFRPSYGVYMLVSLGIALSTGTTLGIARYAMVLFPIYLIAASMRSSVAQRAWIIGSTLLMALDITLFVNHYWAG